MEQIRLPKEVADGTLNDLTKEELIEKIKSLQSHNKQLKNLLMKSNETQLQKRPKKEQKPFDFATCTFRHVLLKFMYLGWDYQGYATQEDTINTIEYHLFEALIKTCLIKNRASSNYHRCGRTDKGVSAFSQVISIDLRSRLKKEQQNPNDRSEEINYCMVLNKVLPDTIQCVAWYPLDNDNFSARFDCKRRTYKYFFPVGNLDIESMRVASKYLLGTHDYRNLCKMDVGNGVVKFIRNISDIDISPSTSMVNGDKNCYDMYVATITGQAFLWHQIRCVVGVLFLIGQGKETPDVIEKLLNVEENPQKPDYNMASEVPLNLYDCHYELDNSRWIYDEATLKLVIEKLQTMWTFNAVKSTMLENMVVDLQQIQEGINKQCFNINCLLNGVKSRKYVPLMKRPKCESLENRIKHYVKRKKLEISDDN